MGAVSAPPPVKLFVGLLTPAPEVASECERILVAQFGEIEVRAGPWPFDSTDYYAATMGPWIERRFLGFRELIRAEALPAIKTLTNGIERELAGRPLEVRRPANLDPGYLEQSKVVLASTKNFYHRILLGDGIYGEVTLAYRARGWQSFPWTFPDFREARYHGFFDALRDVYRSQLRAACRIKQTSRMAERGGFEPPTPV